MIIARTKADQNQAWVDPWTLVHFSTGLATSMMNLPRGWMLAAAVLYELGEQVFERDSIGQRFFGVSGPESLTNAFIDVLVFAGGQYLGTLWNQTGEPQP